MIFLLFLPENPKPNKFTSALGNQYALQVEAAGMSQAELARYMYVRRATLSDVENGKADIDAVTLTLVAYTLKKPLTYFFPRNLFAIIDPKELTEFEQELIVNFRELRDDDQVKIIAQIRAITNTYFIG